jgi:hypothetical protein
MPFAGMHLGMPSIQGIKKPCLADQISGEVKLAKREQASPESADEISGEVKLAKREQASPELAN